jgi:cytochrome c2
MSTIKTIGQIIEGHTNKALAKAGMLNDDMTKLSEARFADCLLCHLTPHPKNANLMGPGLNESNRCKQCSCDMEAKTKVIDAKCPIGRW